MIDNPAYKGKWYPPMISNPAYKVTLASRKLDSGIKFVIHQRSVII